MSIEFSGITGVSDDYGVVTQITDASGRVLWMVQGGGGDKVVLEVEKITSDTYAGETTYTAEEFIVLDIYPKTNGTVSVTYGGLTKTITDTSGAEVPNAQQVFFGTFNGVTDEVETPASGTLTIEGDYRGFGVEQFKTSKLLIGWCGCITAIRSLGVIEYIPDYAFQHCGKLTRITIPESVKDIGVAPFQLCDNLTSVLVDGGNTHYYAEDGVLFNISKTEIIDTVRSIESYVVPNGVTDIGTGAFFGNTKLTNVTIPESVTSIHDDAFLFCTSLDSVTFAFTGTDKKYWYVRNDSSNSVVVDRLDVTDPANNAYMIRGNGEGQYGQYMWTIRVLSGG